MGFWSRTFTWWNGATVGTSLFSWRNGKEVGRHHIISHAYWREGGPEFAGVNLMAVAHGTDKQLVLEHKAAIDRHLEARLDHYPTQLSGGEMQRVAIGRAIVRRRSAFSMSFAIDSGLSVGA